MTSPNPVVEKQKAEAMMPDLIEEKQAIETKISANHPIQKTASDLEAQKEKILNPNPSETKEISNPEEIGISNPKTASQRDSNLVIENSNQKIQTLNQKTAALNQEITNLEQAIEISNQEKTDLEQVKEISNQEMINPGITNQEEIGILNLRMAVREILNRNLGSVDLKQEREDRMASNLAQEVLEM
jgi:hypothetical protein